MVGSEEDTGKLPRRRPMAVVRRTRPNPRDRQAECSQASAAGTWQRRSGIWPDARVLVPLDWPKPAKRQPEASFREGFRDELPEFSRLVSVLEGELAEKGRGVAALEMAVATLRE